jgi:NitT/TauT family transport system permease protein
MSADLTDRRALAGLDNLELQEALAAGPGRKGRMAAKTWAATWPKLLAIAIVLVLWQLVYLADWHGSSTNGIMKGPVQTLPVLWHDLQHAQLWGAIGTTLRSALIGYSAALVIGSLVGALVSRIKPLRAAVGSIITGLQTMPSIAWFPFAIIFFGISQAAILFVVILGAAPSIANGLIAGVDYTPPLLLRAGKVLGLKRVALYRHLILPASLPSFIAGMKQGWAFAWRSLLAGELIVQIANRPSLGQFLNQSREFGDTTYMIALMLVILVIGIVVDGVFSTVDNGIRRRRGVVPSS